MESILLISGALKRHGRSVPLEEFPNSAKLSICGVKKEPPTYRETGKYMLFCFRELHFIIFILPMDFLKQVVHK